MYLIVDIEFSPEICPASTTLQMRKSTTCLCLQVFDVVQGYQVSSGRGYYRKMAQQAHCD